MSIENYADAAKAKIAELEQQIAAIQQTFNDANSNLTLHQAALAALEGIAPEFKVALNALISQDAKTEILTTN